MRIDFGENTLKTILIAILEDWMNVFLDMKNTLNKEDFGKIKKENR